MRAAAEPLPDDPDDHWEDEIQVTRIPDSSRVSIFISILYEVMEKESLTPWCQYRDPLVGILDYITQVCLPEYDRTF
jgi:hypothetical protein